MQSLETSHQIKYTLAPKDGGVMLCIWEPASLTENRAKPFLFMVRQRFQSEEEAQKVLDYYLLAYKVLALK